MARYHKHNLYFEEAFNTPPQPEIIAFDTPFAGRFGLIICFDILFRDPTVALVEEVENKAALTKLKTFHFICGSFRVYDSWSSPRLG